MFEENDTLRHTTDCRLFLASPYLPCCGGVIEHKHFMYKIFTNKSQWIHICTIVLLNKLCYLVKSRILSGTEQFFLDSQDYMYYCSNCNRDESNSPEFTISLYGSSCDFIFILLILATLLYLSFYLLASLRQDRTPINIKRKERSKNAANRI